MCRGPHNTAPRASGCRHPVLEYSSYPLLSERRCRGCGKYLVGSTPRGPAVLVSATDAHFAVHHKERRWQPMAARCVWLVTYLSRAARIQQRCGRWLHFLMVIGLCRTGKFIGGRNRVFRVFRCLSVTALLHALALKSDLFIGHSLSQRTKGLLRGVGHITLRSAVNLSATNHDRGMLKPVGILRFNLSRLRTITC